MNAFAKGIEDKLYLAEKQLEFGVPYTALASLSEAQSISQETGVQLPEKYHQLLRDTYKMQLLRDLYDLFGLCHPTDGEGEQEIDAELLHDTYLRFLQTRELADRITTLPDAVYDIGLEFWENKDQGGNSMYVLLTSPIDLLIMDSRAEAELMRENWYGTMMGRLGLMPESS